jgi:hypothetical protein
MTQLAIALFGLTALYLSMVRATPRAMRWAPVIGLMGQPAWLWATWSAGQFGMFGLCVAYTVVYAVAAWKFWRTA